MYKLFILLSILISGCGTYPVAKFDSDQVTLLCEDQNHQPVTIVKNYKAKYLRDLAYATWNEETEEREIHISDNITDHWPLSVVEFVAYHECAHHQLDHIDTSEHPEPRLLWSDKAMMEERDADCDAIETFYSVNGEDKYESLLDDLKSFGHLPRPRLKRISLCI